MRNSLLFIGFLLLLVLSGACSSTPLVTSAVAYQSVRTATYKTDVAPDDAKISVSYSITKTGGLNVTIHNLTSEIMIVDQAMSFFVAPNGVSTSYYDPTVTTTSTTDLLSSTKGASVNLGAVGGALGIGGAVGTLLSGVNVGGSGTQGQSVTTTTYKADQRQFSLGPNGSGTLSKAYSITRLGTKFLDDMSEASYTNLSMNDSYCKFSVCISYSVDNGATFNKIMTDFYANSLLVAPVTKRGKVNDALRTIYAAKPDALSEQWWILYFRSNLTGSSIYDTIKEGILYDYQN